MSRVVDRTVLSSQGPSPEAMIKSMWPDTQISGLFNDSDTRARDQWKLALGSPSGITPHQRANRLVIATLQHEGEITLVMRLQQQAAGALGVQAYLLTDTPPLEAQGVQVLPFSGDPMYLSPLGATINEGAR